MEFSFRFHFHHHHEITFSKSAEVQIFPEVTVGKSSIVKFILHLSDNFSKNAQTFQILVKKIFKCCCEILHIKYFHD